MPVLTMPPMLEGASTLGSDQFMIGPMNSVLVLSEPVVRVTFEALFDWKPR